MLVVVLFLILVSLAALDRGYCRLLALMVLLAEPALLSSSTADAESACGGALVAGTGDLVASVGALRPAGGGLLEVHFQQLEAIYTLDRKHECYESSLRLLDGSLQKGSAVRFWSEIDRLEIVDVAEYPQLFVAARLDVTHCRPAPPEWVPLASFDLRLPDQVRWDLGSYFGGRSIQATSVLEAAWHGVVRFCGPTDEAVVMEALAEAVVRPSAEELLAEGLLVHDLPPGAEELLTAFAGPALRQALSAIEVRNEDEARRKAAALARLDHLAAAAVSGEPLREGGDLDSEDSR